MSMLRSKWREVLIVAVAALALGLDQLSKAAVVRHLAPQVPWNPIDWLRPIVSLTYVTNTGAAFGLFPQLGSLYIVLVPAIVVALLVFYRRFALSSWLMRVSLGLQLGGALGNLIDRVRLGHVIDFIDFKVWPVFNVADSCVVVGVVILAILMLRQAPEEAPQLRGQSQSQGLSLEE